MNGVWSAEPHNACDQLASRGAVSLAFNGSAYTDAVTIFEAVPIVDFGFHKRVR